MILAFWKDLQGNPPVIYVPFGAREAYCQAKGWRDYASTIRECPIAVPFSVNYEMAKIIHQGVKSGEWRVENPLILQHFN